MQDVRLISLGEVESDFPWIVQVYEKSYWEQKNGVRKKISEEWAQFYASYPHLPAQFKTYHHAFSWMQSCLARFYLKLRVRHRYLEE